jgi:DNA primase
MACHLAGVTTAVATCGTAFGEDHARILRRLLLDHDEFRGEVIFTFDGDAAGQKAALRAFQGDQQFVGQTYVTVEPDGRDPCELRIAEGDAAVRELIARRVPLYRFVLGNVVSRFDLDRADSRVDAIREAAKLVASVRDRSKVEAFARELAGMVGAEIDDVRAEVRKAASRPKGSATPSRPADPPGDQAEETVPSNMPDPLEKRFSIERDVLKLAVQHPKSIETAWADLDADDFTHPYYRSIYSSISEAGGPTAAAATDVLSAAITMPAIVTVLSALRIEQLHLTGDPDERVASAYVVRLRELTVLRRIDQVKSKLQRTNPVTEVTEYNRMFGELVALESLRRTLREQAIGGTG